MGLTVCATPFAIPISFIVAEPKLELLLEEVLSNDRSQHFLVAMDSADWYCRAASKLEGQQQAVVAETARRLLHFQGHSRRNTVRERVVSIEAPGTKYGFAR
jgi:hypothetical protein